MRQILLFILLCLQGGTYASATDVKNERAVVIKKITGKPKVPGGATYTLNPPAIVEVVERQKDKVLVQRLYGESEAIWVPPSSIASPFAFQPISVWNGQNKFSVSAEDGDSGMIYTFNSDATFNSVYTGEQTIYDKGRLYKYERVIWAQRPGPNEKTLYGWSLFWIQDNGKLCYIHDNGQCGSDDYL